jgi:AraC-like DNA-binding protein
MHRFDENLPRIMKVTPSRTRALIIFPTGDDQPEMQVNGIEISQHEIAKISLDWDWYLRSSGPCEWGTMSLTPEDLAGAGKAITGRELAPPTFTCTLTPTPPALSRLQKLHDVASHLAKTAPDILAKPEVARAMEQALVEAMVFCLADCESQDVRNIQRNRAKAMRRMEEALMAHPDEPLYMAELAAQVGMSYWTLRDCCVEYLGISPKRYLWLRRMHLTRRALRRADAKTKTVTEIASDYGFWELGRFSVDYRSLFGESPSIALRRPPPSPSDSDRLVLESPKTA